MKSCGGQRVEPEYSPERACRVCGCTEGDACVTGSAPIKGGRVVLDEGRASTCHWVEADLCSRCEGQPAVLHDTLVLVVEVLGKLLADIRAGKPIKKDGGAHRALRVVAKYARAALKPEER